MIEKKSFTTAEKVNSILSFSPLTFFLLIHLVINLTVVFDPYFYNNYIIFSDTLKLIINLIIIVPLIYHVLYGLYITFITRTTTLNRKLIRYNRWGYLVQRILGILTGIFISFHIIVFLVVMGNRTPETKFTDMIIQHITFYNPFILILYVVGVSACCIHASIGLWTAGHRYNLVRYRFVGRYLPIIAFMFGLITLSGYIALIFYYLS